MNNNKIQIHKNIYYFPMLSTLIISSETWLGDVSKSYMLFDSLFTEKLSLNMSVGKLCWLKLDFESAAWILQFSDGNATSEWDSFGSGCK